jgi:CheY-like chemotaxis protein
VAAVLRHELGLDKLPIIALTAGVLPEEKQNALDAGINDFLPKPMVLDQMAEMISRYCGSSMRRAEENGPSSD